MLTEFDKLVKEKQALEGWWSAFFGKTEYGGGRYVLRVDIQPPTLVAFCGQAYAGAKNYHDCPPFFVRAVKAELDKRAGECVRVAYENEIARLNAAILSYKEQALKLLNEIDSEDPVPWM